MCDRPPVSPQAIRDFARAAVHQFAEAIARTPEERAWLKAAADADRDGRSMPKRPAAAEAAHA